MGPLVKTSDTAFAQFILPLAQQAATAHKSGTLVDGCVPDGAASGAAAAGRKLLRGHLPAP